MNGQNTTAAQQYGGPQTARVREVGPTLIGETTEEVASAAGRVWALAVRVREFNDGINGSVPQTADSKGLAKLSSSARGDNLRSAVGTLNEGINALQVEVERLDRI